MLLEEAGARCRRLPAPAVSREETGILFTRWRTAGCCLTTGRRFLPQKTRRQQEEGLGAGTWGAQLGRGERRKDGEGEASRAARSLPSFTLRSPWKCCVRGGLLPQHAAALQAPVPSVPHGGRVSAGLGHAKLTVPRVWLLSNTKL